jgi:hypothetical protein
VLAQGGRAPRAQLCVRRVRGALMRAGAGRAACGAGARCCAQRASVGCDAPTRSLGEGAPARHRPACKKAAFRGFVPAPAANL